MLTSPDDIFDNSLRLLASGLSHSSSQIQATTCIGLVNKEGVIVAADSRASLNTGQIVTDSFDKLFEIDDHSIAAVSGTVSLAQSIAKFLKAKLRYESDLYEGYQIPPKTKLNTTISVINQFRSLSGGQNHEMFIAPIFGTYDFDKHNLGGRIFIIFPDTSLTPERQFECVGSGSPTAGPVLKVLLCALNKNPGTTDLRSSLALQEAIYLAVSSLIESSHRDSHTGENIKIASITRGGIDYIDQDLILDITRKVKRGEVVPQ